MSLQRSLYHKASLLVVFFCLGSCSSIFYEVESNVEEISQTYEVEGEKPDNTRKVERWIDDMRVVMNSTSTVVSEGGGYVARGVRGRQSVNHNGDERVLEYTVIAEIGSGLIKLRLIPNGWHTDVPKNMDEKKVIMQLYNNEVESRFLEVVRN